MAPLSYRDLKNSFQERMITPSVVFIDRLLFARSIGRAALCVKEIMDSRKETESNGDTA
jgi:hypothetical protein